MLRIVACQFSPQFMVRGRVSLLGQPSSFQAFKATFSARMAEGRVFRPAENNIPHAANPLSLSPGEEGAANGAEGSALRPGLKPRPSAAGPA